MQIRLKVDPDRLKWRDWKLIMKGRLEDMEALQAIVSRFVTDERGEYLSEKEAIALLDELETPEIMQVFNEFGEAIRDLAVPPMSGSNLSLPSTTAAPAPGG